MLQRTSKGSGRAVGLASMPHLTQIPAKPFLVHTPLPFTARPVTSCRPHLPSQIPCLFHKTPLSIPFLGSRSLGLPCYQSQWRLLGLSGPFLNLSVAFDAASCSFPLQPSLSIQGPGVPGFLPNSIASFSICSTGFPPHSGSQQGRTAPKGGWSGDIFSCHTWGSDMASSG